MKILAIDTCSEACSVAVKNGAEIFSKFEFQPRRHTAIILPMIKEILAQGELLLSELDCVGFTAGPGSFTGIRVAAGIVQGLAFAFDIPVACVSSLATLAQQAYRLNGVEKILPALDARMNQVYWGGYNIQEGVAVAVFPDEVADPDKVSIPEGVSFYGIGPGWKAYGPKLQEALAGKLLENNSEVFPHAEDVIPLAEKIFQAKKTVKAENALPVYLREKVVL